MTYFTKKGSVEFTVIFCAVTVFILLPLFGTIAQKIILYQKKIMVYQSVDLAVMAAYTSLDTSHAGTGELVLTEGKFHQIFKNVLSKNLKLDNTMEGYPNSIVNGKVEIVKLEFFNTGLPVTVGKRTFIYPFIRCEIKVPVKADIFSQLINQERCCIHETIYTELPFDK